FGVERDPERYDKALLLERALGERGVEPRRAAMVGDRSHDMLGARSAGLRAIGAGWGYGSLEELRASHASAIASSPLAILDHLPPL
ncbi:MAG: HAD hydrolase-like protein, partial [Myxococcota bacterium]